VIIIPNTRDLNLKKYGISKWLYRELRAFTLQYPEKKSRISFGVPDQKRAMTLQEDVLAVERAAKTASSKYWAPLLYGETHDVRYFYLYTYRGLACSEKEYRSMRHRFYYELAKNLKKI